MLPSIVQAALSLILSPLAYFNDAIENYDESSNTLSPLRESKDEFQIIDLHHFKFALNSEICQSDPSIPIIATVKSSINNFATRQAIRLTWGRPTNFLKLVFLLGLTEDVNLASLIQEEHKTYGDIIQGTFLDTYKNVTYKTVMGLKWVTLFCPGAGSVMMVEDDTFVHVRELRALAYRLMSRGRDNMIIGKVSQVLEKDPAIVMPPFCDGLFTMYTPKVAAKLVEAAKNEKYVPYEDVFVTGILRRKLSLTLGNIDYLYLEGEDAAKILDGDIERIPKFVYGPRHLEVQDVYLLWNITEQFDKRRRVPRKHNISESMFQWMKQKSQHLNFHYLSQRIRP